MIFDLLLSGRQLSVTPGPTDDFWYSPAGASTKAGVNVTQQSALKYSAVWACTRAICETSAMLPFKVYENLRGGGKSPAKSHPANRLIQYAPNPEMSAMPFWEAVLACTVNWGNGFAEIERTVSGDPIALWPIHASRVPKEKAYRNAKGELVYSVKENDGGYTDVPSANMLHIPGLFADDGVWGKGVIDYAREAIGGAIAKEQFGGTFFGNNATPGGVLEHPGELKEEAVKRLRAQWNDKHQGPQNAHKIAVLEAGMKYSAIGIPPEQAQFLESRQFDVEEIARWYRISPHLIGHLLRATFSNIENLGLEYVKYGLMGWLVRTEGECNRKLIHEKDRDRYYTKHNVDALERADLATRTAANKDKFFNGLQTINEWREIEDMNPIGPEGDVHMVQGAMVTLQDAIEGPPEPPAAPAPKAEPDPKPEDPAPADGGKLSVAREWLSESIARVLRKEGLAARRAAEKPNEYLSWLDTFYEKHLPFVGDALGKPLGALGIAQDEFCRAFVERSRSDLLAASDGDPKTFAERVGVCVEGWLVERANVEAGK